MEMRGKSVGDPVNTEDGKWYFWDETWTHNYGPFDTEQLCEEQLKKYSEYLG